VAGFIHVRLGYANFGQGWRKLDPLAPGQVRSTLGRRRESNAARAASAD